MYEYVLTWNHGIGISHIIWYQREYTIPYDVNNIAYQDGQILADERISEPASDKTGHKGDPQEDEQQRRCIIGRPVQWQLIQEKNIVADDSVVGEALAAINNEQNNEGHILSGPGARVIHNKL